MKVLGSHAARTLAALAVALAPACTGEVWTLDPEQPVPTDDAAVEPGTDAAVEPGTDAWLEPGTDAWLEPLPALDTGPPLGGARGVLFSGHSLININSPIWFEQISERAGRDVRYELQMGVGSPMSVRLACPRSGQQADGNPISFSVLSELARPGAYDTLVLTERHDIVTTILYEASTSMTRRFRDALREGNPSARAFLFESWFTIDLANPEAFRARQARELVAWQCIASRVNETRGDMAPMLVVPAGQAISELVSDVLAGRAPGFATLRDVFLDDVHLTPDANYLVALIHYGVVHQEAPRGMRSDALATLSGSGPSLTAEQAGYLEGLAARTLERTFAEAALSQRSEAECASLIVPVCTAVVAGGGCSGIAAALRNDTAPVPTHEGSWCLR
jgi:hypothetical protein